VIEPCASLRRFLRAFQERRLDEVPWAPLSKPLAECRIAVVAGSVCLVRGSAGEYPRVEIGDPGFRDSSGDSDTGMAVARSRGRAGISTVALSLLHAAVAEVRPPRTLWVPLREGSALGAPNDPEHRRAVLEAVFEMLEDAGLTARALRDFSAHA